MKSMELSARTVAAGVDQSTLGMVISDPTLEDCPVIYANDGFQRITLYSRDYAIGRNCRFLQGEGTSATERDRINKALAAGEKVNAQIVNYKADGTRFINHLSISPVFEEDGKLTAFFGVIREGADDEEPAAQDGEGQSAKAGGPGVMLHEIQHRVKNHLAMIVSLIRIQAERPVTRESYIALSHRIEALALLYDELLQPRDGSDGEMLEAGAYLSRVATVIAGIDGRASVRVSIDCADVRLRIDPAARLGLLLTELMTNAFAHAFEGRESGNISVILTQTDDGRVRLTVEDDGVGLPEGNDWPYNSASVQSQTRDAETADGQLDTTAGKRASGLGGTIVLGLTKALDARLDVDTGDAGTRVTVNLDPGRRVA